LENTTKHNHFATTTTLPEDDGSSTTRGHYLKKQSKQKTIPSEIPQKQPETFSYSAKGP